MDPDDGTLSAEGFEAFSHEIMYPFKPFGYLELVTPQRPTTKVTPGTVVKRSARDVAFCKPQVSTD
jgi:hypothetical protein